MPPTARTGRVVAALALLAAAAAPLRAETPREQLLRYVPEKVGFCLVLNDLRGHSEALVDSPLVEQFRDSPLGKSLAAAVEIEQLGKAEKDLKELFGLDWKQLRDEIFGDAVVFVYRPGPPDKPKDEQGLLLLHARDPKLLVKMVETINAKQKDKGELKELEEKQFKGKKYFRRTDTKETSFYHLDGSVLIFTAQEDMLREALGTIAAKKDGESPAARRFRELGGDKALLSVWINPRAFDAHLEANAKRQNATPNELAFIKGFTPYWKALDNVVISAALEKDFKVRVGFQTRVDDLPTAARRFLKEASKPSEIWRAVPDNAMFAFGGRLDLPSLFELLGDFMPEADRKAGREQLNRIIAAPLGKDDCFKDVLPNIGPDFGMYLTAPPADDKAWAPRGALAVRVGDGGQNPPFNKSVLNVITAQAQVAVAFYNLAHPDQTMSLKTAQQGKREVTYLVNDKGFPMGFQLALALHDNYLVLATSPEEVRRFAEALKPGDAKTPDEFPLLRISYKELRKWLKDRREVLTPIIAEQNKLSNEDAQKRLDGLLAGLDFVDRLEISQRTAPGQVVFTLTLQTSRPLRK
jgi:hypothetical protein